MKHFLQLILVSFLLSSCNNIRSVSYTEPTKFKNNILYLPNGSYAAVRPAVPQRQKNEAAEVLADSFINLAGTCYHNIATVRNLEIELEGTSLSQNALNQLKFAPQQFDYIVFLSAKYKEPVITEFNDSRYYRQPEEHVTAILQILDVAQNSVIYSQSLIGSTEDTYNAFDPNGDEEEDIIFKAEGGMLVMKVIRRLLNGVSKKANSSDLVCSKAI